MRLSRRMIVRGLCSLPFSQYARASENSVDTALVLAIDSSGSITPPEWKLQMQGYSDAFAASDVHAALFSGEHGAIALTAFAWSSTGLQRIIMPWTRIAEPKDAVREARAFVNCPQHFQLETSISSALMFSGELMRICPFQATRKVIDISGDGTNNQNDASQVTNDLVPVTSIRDRIVSQGIVINGIAILTEVPDLDRYYAEQVIGGEGSFVVAAKSFADFGEAIQYKLTQEIRVSRRPDRMFG